MDPISIILTIGAVVSGLLVLWALLWVLFVIVGGIAFKRGARKMDKDFEREWKRMEDLI